MVTSQLYIPDATGTSSHQHQASPTSLSPSWQQPDHPTAHDRFRQIFRNHWDHWCDQRLEAEVPPDQRAYVRKIVQRLMSCRDPNAGYARYICPGCQYERHVPFSCKTRFCPSCGKVRVDNWVNDIARDLLKVPHLHITLTTDDLLWPCFLDDRPRLKILLHTAAQAVRELVEELYPGVRIKGLEAARYIGRYLGHPPIATSHIVDYDAHNVTYWYIDTATGLRQTVTCSALDFTSCLVPHIPPKGMQIVRYAGLYARNVQRMLFIRAGSQTSPALPWKRSAFRPLCSISNRWFSPSNIQIEMRVEARPSREPGLNGQQDKENTQQARDRSKDRIAIV